jgi:hypothetical protein
LWSLALGRDGRPGGSDKLTLAQSLLASLLLVPSEAAAIGGAGAD